ncbi:MAG: hypothetical protein ACK4N5_19245, partial [Myxococcales bacterium]
MKRSGLVAALCVVFTGSLAVSCGGRGVEEQEPCTSDSQCRIGSRCVDGFCTDETDGAPDASTSRDAGNNVIPAPDDGGTQTSFDAGQGGGDAGEVSADAGHGDDGGAPVA